LPIWFRPLRPNRTLDSPLEVKVVEPVRRFTAVESIEFLAERADTGPVRREPPPPKAGCQTWPGSGGRPSPPAKTRLLRVGRNRILAIRSSRQDRRRDQSGHP